MNVMTIYEKKNAGAIAQTELHLYGSSRIGIIGKQSKPATYELLANGYGKIYNSTFTRGEKAYELTNHLGNVLVTVSDKKLPVDEGTYGYQLFCPQCANNPDPNFICPPCSYLYIQTSTTPDGIIDYYNADVLTATDYAPFGMALVGRSYSSGGYRYGFNGKENDKDISEGGQDYGMRIYDSRLGRFLSDDPLAKGYPWYSPYHFAGNNPIRNLDMDGGEPKDYIKNWIGRQMIINDLRRVNNEIEYTPASGVYSYRAVYDKVSKQYWFVMQKPGDPTHYFWQHKDGADPNRLIQSTSGKLDNGEWMPFETEDSRQARIGVDVANGMAIFWYGILSTSIATGGRALVWMAESILEDLLGVPILNSPDDLGKKRKIYTTPGRVKSRINITKEAMEHIEERHFNPGKNASQFTISKDEFKSLLSDEKVLKNPIVNVVESADKGTLYMRIVDFGKNIGTDKFNNFKPTSTMTVATDKFGNLVTATPGIIK